ncbi:MAG: ATP-binding cassette subfamily B protein [Granulosicoccus sp.]
MKVSDPAIGLRSYTYKEFLNHWGNENKGIVLMLSPRPGANIEHNSTISNNQFGFIYEYLKPYKFLIGQLFLSLFLAMIIQILLPFLTQTLVDYGINYEDIGFI